MDQQQFCLRWNNHGSTLVAVFDNLFANESLVDVTLFAEGQVLKAHKVVLSACSPYFQRLFSETRDRHPIVVLKDVGHRELRALLEYMYRGQVNVAQDQLEPLIRTAESLRIKGLADGPRGAPNPLPGPTPPLPRPDAADTQGDGSSPLSGGGMPPTNGSPAPQGPPVPPSQPDRVKAEALEPRPSAPRPETGGGFPLCGHLGAAPSVLSTVLTLPPALSLAAAAAAATPPPCPHRIKLETRPPLDHTPASPQAKRRRKARTRSGGDGDSGGDSAPPSPPDTLPSPLHQLPRIPATITPVAVHAALAHGALLRDEGGTSGSSSGGCGGGSSSPSPDSLMGCPRGDSAPPPHSPPLPRPLSAASPSPFKAFLPRHDDNSSDALNHSDDEGEGGAPRHHHHHHHHHDATPSTSQRLDDTPITPTGYLGWPYPQDPPGSSEDAPFPSLENTNQEYLRAYNLVRAGFQGLLPPRVTASDILTRPPPIGLPLMLKNASHRTGEYKFTPGDYKFGSGDYKYSGAKTPSTSTGVGYPFADAPKQFACEKCGRTYASTGNLKRHKKYECGVEPQFSCPICKKKFQHRHSVKIHVFSTHRNEAGEGGPPDSTRDSPALFPSSEGMAGVVAGVVGGVVGQVPCKDEYFPIPQEANAPSSQNQDG